MPFQIFDPTMNQQATNAPEQAGQAPQQQLSLLDGQGPGYTDSPTGTTDDPGTSMDFTDDPLYIEVPCERNWGEIGGGFLLGLAIGYAVNQGKTGKKKKKGGKRAR